MALLARFDSGACFAALLGGRGTGGGSSRRLARRGHRRRYRDDTLILETEFETAEGVRRGHRLHAATQARPDVVRIVEGLRGRVAMRMELIVRFDYGSHGPLGRRVDDALRAIAGPDEPLLADAGATTRGEDMTTVAEFTVSEGEQSAVRSHLVPVARAAARELDAGRALDETEAWWQHWATLHATGPLARRRHALADRPEGADLRADRRHRRGADDLAAGAARRRAKLGLPLLLAARRDLHARRPANAGYTDEARAWRDWLLRVVAGDPARSRSCTASRASGGLTEFEVPWLPGYEGSRPVRIGNAACEQIQLDVYGEVMDALYHAEELGLEAETRPGRRKLLDHLESEWREPDSGIWEVRGPRRHFTHSKVMAWVAVDRAARAVHSHADGSVDRGGACAEIHEEVCARDSTGTELVRPVLRWEGARREPLAHAPGRVPTPVRRARAGDGRGDRAGLCENGFVMRYRHDEETDRVDGLPPGEGAFLPCTFWLADNLNLIGRHDDAVALFERLLGLRNDVGLISEEYDSENELLVGNFPQAFTHVELVNTAMNLSQSEDRPLARWERFRQLGAKRN